MGVQGAPVAPTAAGPANPTAFWLSLAGLIVQGLTGLMTLGMFSAFSGFGMRGFYGGMMGGYFSGAWNTFAWVWMIAAAVTLILGVLGVIWMNSPALSKVRVGSVLVLLAAVAAAPMMWGLWIGSILMVVGAVMGCPRLPEAPRLFRR